MRSWLSKPVGHDFTLAINALPGPSRPLMRFACGNQQTDGSCIIDLKVAHKLAKQRGLRRFEVRWGGVSFVTGLSAGCGFGQGLADTIVTPLAPIQVLVALWHRSLRAAHNFFWNTGISARMQGPRGLSGIDPQNILTTPRGVCGPRCSTLGSPL
jgi:hypothetical protein